MSRPTLDDWARGRPHLQRELSLLRENIASERNAKIERGEMLVEMTARAEKAGAEVARLLQLNTDIAEVSLRNAQERDDLAVSVSSLSNALEAQRALWESLPSGVDYDADPEDTSPQDLVAHIAGLAVREIDKVLGKPEEKP